LPEAGHRRRRILYGRRRGKRPRPGRQALLEARLPGLALELAGVAPGTLEPGQLFGTPVRASWLEIGFGAGEHLAWQLAANPEVGILGAEPYLAGVARLVGALDEAAVPRLRLLLDDGRLLLEALAPASLERLFTLFPDPWPKARHHKRRLVQPETAAAAARVLASGGEWRLATDDMDYARWMLRCLTGNTEFEWLARHADDWRHRPADWPETRYEAKALAAGRRPLYLRFRRRDPG
jgi:tRNA (guanine-N7-)-methyltransferase